MPSVKLEIVRIGERAAQPFLTLHPPGNDLIEHRPRQPSRGSGTTVWTGTAAIPASPAQRSDPHEAAVAGDRHRRAGHVRRLRAADRRVRAHVSTNTSAAQLDAADRPGADHVAGCRRPAGAGARLCVGAAESRAWDVALIAADNDVLATAVTDAQRSSPVSPLRWCTGPTAHPQRALHLRGPDGDATVLNLTRPAFDLSDRGVTGRAIVEGTDAFIWLDRDIFRPGETVHAMALPRDPAGIPVTKRFHAVVTRPNAQVFADIVAAHPGRTARWRCRSSLPGGAALGTWKISLRPTVDGATISEAAFQVDAFVPARLAVDLGKPADMLTPGRTASLPVAVRFLYGAPGSDLSGSADISITANPKPFDAYADYKFGLADEKDPGSERQRRNAGRRTRRGRRRSRST